MRSPQWKAIINIKNYNLQINVGHNDRALWELKSKQENKVESKLISRCDISNFQKPIIVKSNNNWKQA